MRTKFTTTLDGELIKQLKIEAINKNTDVSKILEELIREYLDKTQKSLDSN